MWVLTFIVSGMALSCAVTTLIAGRFPGTSAKTVAEFQRWVMIAGFYGFVTLQLGGLV